MPVVINDFEVVPEPAAPAQQGGTAPQTPPHETPDVERILAVHRARAERVRAY